MKRMPNGRPKFDDLPAWFAERTIPEPNTGCLFFTGSIGNGYGLVRYYVDGKRVRENATRMAWILVYGPIPEGLFVLHHCDTPECVNVEHMFLGTNYDNVLDKVLKGRQHCSPKLLLEQCAHGHDFDEANTYIRPDGMRACRKCKVRRHGVWQKKNLGHVREYQRRRSHAAPNPSLPPKSPPAHNHHRAGS